MTDFKNKHHKQVWPLFTKCVQIRQLIQLMKFASLQTYTLPNACAASTLMPLNVLAATFPLSHILSLSLSLTSFPNLENYHKLSLSLSAHNPLPRSNNLNPHPINYFPMASTRKCSSTTGFSAQGSNWVRLSLLLSVLSSVARANWTPISSMGFDCLLSLPIATIPFKLLKSLDLFSL